MRAWDSDGAVPGPDNEGTRSTDKANQRKSAVGSDLGRADDIEAKSSTAKFGRKESRYMSTKEVNE